MKKLSPEIRRCVNQVAHAEAQRHEIAMRAALIKRLQAMADAGAGVAELRQHLDVATGAHGAAR